MSRFRTFLFIIYLTYILLSFSGSIAGVIATVIIFPTVFRMSCGIRYDMFVQGARCKRRVAQANPRSLRAGRTMNV